MKIDYVNTISHKHKERVSCEIDAFEDYIGRLTEEKRNEVIAHLSKYVKPEMVEDFANLLSWGVNDENSSALALMDELHLTQQDLAAIDSDYNKMAVLIIKEREPDYD